jgi:RNA polymerase sigma-70 factor (ECF subfamily)
MLNRALGVLGDRGLAEDAVHEAFLRIARHLPRFERLSEKESRYLCLAITKNAALNLRRDRGDPLSLTEDLPSPQADLSLRADLAGALAALEDGYRQVVLLRLHYGFNTAETARLMGITRDAVRGRLKRARAVLREALSEKAPENGAGTKKGVTL